ncbi:enoyl-CoA hydratase/isomerase family protein [Haladaptatus halobius]|uniref:enoyl-CoA hydratase/isomerase family protein n=1 Tax=Haladaptatus halobius TaxID=2884875 RepID=UPI001D0A16CA|nr:enoyl-CoA hydratase-related protein [Haladaptatus halobius]
MGVLSQLLMEQGILSQTEKVRYETDGRIGKITINRPEKLNAMDSETYRALSEAWTTFQTDDDVWVGIVTGEGNRAFSAGADLTEAVEPGSVEWPEFWRTQEEMLLNNGLDVWKPVIAAVNGYCLAGGLTLLLATDIRIAGESAQFGLSEVKRGILPGNGGTQRAIRQLPHMAAMELLLTGDHVDAERARDWNLVTTVVPDEEVMSVAEEYAARILANGPLAVRAIKELTVRGRNMSLADAMRLEESFQYHLLQTEDAKEGVVAFAEDREPDYRAR